jgi:poly-gamma-glutamate synthesis protein (capsule biosynthesis protein)
VRVSITVLLFIGFGVWVQGQERSELRLVFAGDIMGHDTQIESALAMGDGERYDYRSCFEHLEPYIQSADIAIGNLEVTLAGPPYKGYPAFSSPDALAEELKRAGFDILVNANNHAIDRGQRGLERTLHVLDSIGLVQTGVFKDRTDRSRRYPLIVEKNGIRLALLNYTYGTNGIRVTDPNIVNYIDTVQMKKDLEKAILAQPDFVIALMHWGNEYEMTENPTQRKLADFLLQNGTDAIIGSHPHVVQPVEVFPGNKLVVWSMGNFISNMRKRATDGGIMAELTLIREDSTWMADYRVLPVWVDKTDSEKGVLFRMVPAAADSTLQDALGMTPDARLTMQVFLEDTRKNLPGIPEAGLNFMQETMRQD